MWPPEALEFLRELEANNDRDWFKANRGLYESHLVEPARELARQLADLGEPYLFRPYNDTRFHMRPPIDDGRRAAAFERAVKAAAAVGLTLSEPELKRAPRGYPQDHPRIDRLRLKELTVHKRHALEPWLHRPACDELIRTELAGARPLVAWLAKHVGPSQRPR